LKALLFGFYPINRIMEPEQEVAEEISHVVGDPVSQIGHNIGDTVSEIGRTIEQAVSRKLDEKLEEKLEEATAGGLGTKKGTGANGRPSL
jgi:hypothetical protein